MLKSLMPAAISLLSPLSSRLFRGKPVSMDVLQPEETESVAPPAMLDCMLPRIVGTDEHSLLSDHLYAATSCQVRHAPVIRYTFRNCLVNRYGFACLNYIEKYSNKYHVQSLTKRSSDVEKLRYCHSYVSWRYFGHWLTDSIPSSMIDDGVGELWMPANPSWSDAKAYSEILNIDRVHNELVLAEELIVYQDYGQGSHKKSRYSEIRREIHDNFKNSDSSGLMVYLRRGATGVLRQIVNEDRLVVDLVAAGWTVLDVSKHSVSEMQSVLCRADVLVSIDGSQIDHAHLSMPIGSLMIVLIPGDRFTVRQLGICRAHEVRSAIVVLEGSMASGYTAKISEIMATLDLAYAPEFRACV